MLIYIFIYFMILYDYVDDSDDDWNFGSNNLNSVQEPCMLIISSGIIDIPLVYCGSSWSMSHELRTYICQYWWEYWTLLWCVCFPGVYTHSHSLIFQLPVRYCIHAHSAPNIISWKHPGYRQAHPDCEYHLKKPVGSGSECTLYNTCNVVYLLGGLEHEFYDFPYYGNFIIRTDELHHFSEE